MPGNGETRRQRIQNLLSTARGHVDRMNRSLDRAKSGVSNVQTQLKAPVASPPVANTTRRGPRFEVVAPPVSNSAISLNGNEEKPRRARFNNGLRAIDLVATNGIQQLNPVLPLPVPYKPVSRRPVVSPPSLPFILPGLNAEESKLYRNLVTKHKTGKNMLRALNQRRISLASAKKIAKQIQRNYPTVVPAPPVVANAPASPVVANAPASPVVANAPAPPVVPTPPVVANAPAVSVEESKLPTLKSALKRGKTVKKEKTTFEKLMNKLSGTRNGVQFREGSSTGKSISKNYLSRQDVDDLIDLMRSRLSTAKARTGVPVMYLNELNSQIFAHVMSKYNEPANIRKAINELNISEESKAKMRQRLNSFFVNTNTPEKNERDQLLQAAATLEIPQQKGLPRRMAPEFIREKLFERIQERFPA